MSADLHKIHDDMLSGLDDFRQKLAEFLPTFEKMDDASVRIDGILVKFAEDHPALAKAAGVPTITATPLVAPDIRQFIALLDKTIRAATGSSVMLKRFGEGTRPEAATPSGCRPLSKADDTRRAEGSYREAPTTPAEITAYVAAMDPDARAALFAKLAATGEKP